MNTLHREKLELRHKIANQSTLKPEIIQNNIKTYIKSIEKEI